jgi:hypothetical protein
MQYNARMNRLTTEKRAQVIGCLVEGMSIRATVRVTGAAKNTVAKLLVDLGKACSDYQDHALRDLPCKRLQLDEIWSFVYAKAKNVPEDHQGEFGYGDVWTWVAIDADSKLVPSWLVGRRDTEDAVAFVTDVADRMAGRVQLMVTSRTSKPSIMALELRSTTPFCRRFTGAIPKVRNATRPPSASARRRASFVASLSLSTSRPHMSSVRTSRCVLVCGASRD